jgi:hypothetical protein
MFDAAISDQGGRPAGGYSAIASVVVLEWCPADLAVVAVSLDQLADLRLDAAALLAAHAVHSWSFRAALNCSASERLFLA